MKVRWIVIGGLVGALVGVVLAGLGGGLARAQKYPALGPLPPIKAPNPDAVKLGKMLFFDNRLSGDADIQCSKCHISSKGWSDGLPLSDGYPGTKYFRNTPTMINATYSKYFYWDGRLDGADLETQVRDIITESFFHAADGRIMLERMNQVPEYVELFRKALGGDPNFGRILKAIAAFEKTLVSRNVPLDRYLKGDKSALSAKARQGLTLFKGKAGCIRCHNGPYISDQKFHNLVVPENPEIFINPFRHITFRAMLKYLGTPNYWNLRRDPGHYAVTKDPKDFGSFITPTLREVSRTAPYMHSGMLPTLEAVVDFYNHGGGKKEPNKSPLLKPLGLSTNEKAALVEFLKSLSGDEIIIQIKQDDLPKYKLIEDWYNVKNIGG